MKLVARFRKPVIWISDRSFLIAIMGFIIFVIPAGGLDMTMPYLKITEEMKGNLESICHGSLKIGVLFILPYLLTMTFRNQG